MRANALLSGLLITALSGVAWAQDAPPQEPTPEQPKPEQPTPEQPKPEQPQPEQPKPDEAKPDEAKKPAGELTPAERKQQRREEAKAKRQEKQARQQAKKQGFDPERQLAPDTPEAQALEKLLIVDSRYAKDGTVELVYTFRESEQVADFERRGFDSTDTLAGRGRGRRARRRADLGKKGLTRLELSVGSNGAGLMLHKLSIQDEFTLTLRVQALRMTKRSDLVFFCGKGGVRLGSVFVKRSGSSFRAVAKGTPNFEAFEGGAVTIQLEARDGVLEAKLNGEVIGQTKKLNGKLDGQVGLYVRNMLLHVHELRIKARVDSSKLLKE